MKFLMLMVVGIFVSLQVAAKTILISDIDDTVKISHVLDTSEAVKNAFKTGNLFAGTNVLYHGVKSQDNSIKFFYVSNAIQALMQNSHAEFLSKNKFPAGLLSLRASPWDKSFKLTEISRIIKTEKPDTVVLIGDNGEKDPVIYAQIVKKYPTIRFITYIHQDYFTQSREDQGAALQPGQIGYVTSWDLLLQLRQQNLINDDFAREFLRGFADIFLPESGHEKEGVLVIPAWIDCRDFVWTANDKDFAGSQDHGLVKERILNRCSHEAIED